jgi:hypothetical protein
MKIELTDREHWLIVVTENLQWIADDRAKEDKKFVERWRKRRFLSDRGDDEFPSGRDYWEYPCHYWWEEENILRHLRAALLAPHTGTIYVDEDELRALGIEGD